mmetsp:Transcript_79239/g.164467  ORF Transcript_79239/g.164467 Transcript_79239/m.164467 type:complete len:730 (+) Transcript_79239:158-2347(+)
MAPSASSPGTAFQLSPEQRRTLASLSDTIVAAMPEPAVQELVRQQQAEKGPNACSEGALRRFASSTGSSMGVPEAVEEAIGKHLPVDMQQSLSILLSAFGSRLGMFALAGVPTAFADLSVKRREQVLNGLRTSMLWPKRKIFILLKSLICIKAYSRAVNGATGKERNPYWEVINFPGGAPYDEVQAEAARLGLQGEHVFEMINGSISEDTVLNVDVVIVGSGCGGSVTAAECAKAGKRVLLLEKGPYLRNEELPTTEGAAFDQLYERGGMLSTEDTGIAVLAGSGFGGGSLVNWGCSLRTPQHVKEEWTLKHGLEEFTDGTFDRALDVVCERLTVKVEGIEHSATNKVLLKGSEKMGYLAEELPQNMTTVKWFEPGALISTADRYGNKQSAVMTFLRDAATAATPARFADRCEVHEVLHTGGRATGVRASVVGCNGVTCSLVVHAPVVVVSCGAIQSPALLKRSKIPDPHKNIGKNLRLHPVMAAVGLMPKDEPVEAWRGLPMTACCEAAAKGPDNDDYGAKLECPVLLPGILSSSIPWTDGTEFKNNLLKYPNAAPIIVLSRDKTSGEVKIDKNGVARLYYPISPDNQKSLMQGLEKTLEVLEAAGAEQLVVGKYDEPVDLPPLSEPEARKKVVKGIMEKLTKAGFEPYKDTVLSAHQMGTCRMGASPTTSVVKNTCECWECEGLFVVDAASFPTSSGANPMITTYAIGYMASQHIKNFTPATPKSRL